MRISRFASGLAMAAALSMTASPVLADGWGGYGHYRHDHDDTGWIVGGLLGIGLIAAIAASSSSKAKHEREARERDDDYRYDGGDNRDGRSNHSYRDPGARYGNGRDDRPAYTGSSRNIDGAVDACVGEVEHGNNVKVDTVDSVGREGGSWRIYGRVADGRDFSCSVDGGLQVHEITVTNHGRG
jgi:hypothetical protein